MSIGNVSTLSGVLGQLFSPVVPALKTFVASQNACNGLNGHPIKLTIADDQGDPSTAVTEGRRLVKEGAVAFLGNIQVLTIDAMTTVVKESGVPIIGGDITNNTWFTNPLLFPQGSPPQSISYGYHVAAAEVFKKKKIGNVYCLEVPQACKEINTAFQELDSAFPDQKTVYTQQISITSPDYTSQCLDAQRAGVEMMAITNDAPTQSRWSNSCAKVGFKPDYVLYPLGVGNEGQFLGNPNLGNGYVPMNHFPWMAGTHLYNRGNKRDDALANRMVDGVHGRFARVFINNDEDVVQRPANGIAGRPARQDPGLSQGALPVQGAAVDHPRWSERPPGLHRGQEPVRQVLPVRGAGQRRQQRVGEGHHQSLVHRPSGPERPEPEGAVMRPRELGVSSSSAVLGCEHPTGSGLWT